MAVSLSSSPGNSNTYDGKILVNNQQSKRKVKNIFIHSAQTFQKHQYECIEDLSSKADDVRLTHTTSPQTSFPLSGTCPSGSVYIMF